VTTIAAALQAGWTPDGAPGSTRGITSEDRDRAQHLLCCLVEEGGILPFGTVQAGPHVSATRLVTTKETMEKGLTSFATGYDVRGTTGDAVAA